MIKSLEQRGLCHDLFITKNGMALLVLPLWKGSCLYMQLLCVLSLHIWSVRNEQHLSVFLYRPLISQSPSPALITSSSWYHSCQNELSLLSLPRYSLSGRTVSRRHCCPSLESNQRPGFLYISIYKSFNLCHRWQT